MMQWKRKWKLLLLISVSVLSTAMIVEDPLTTPTIFKIGVFQFDKSIEDRFILDLLKRCSSLDKHTSFDYSTVFLLLKGTQGWRLSELAESYTYQHIWTKTAELLSHRINSCPSAFRINEEKEVLLHAALAVWPWNTYVQKNLLFYYEWHGFNGAMKALYTDSLLLTGDESILLQQVFSSPPVLHSIQQAQNIHFDMLKKTHNFLVHAEVTTHNPQQEIRELQQNIEYIGYSTGLVMELYMLCVQRRYAPFFHPNMPVLSPSVPTTVSAVGAPAARTLRVGVVSEHANNGAPDLCIVEIFSRLQLECAEEDSDSVNCTSLDIVFFDRPWLRNDFASVLRSRAREVITLIETDVVASAAFVQEADVDVLLYIALPTEKFTVLLSQYRLAKTQVVFGAGHPLSSGATSIDYSILAHSFVSDPTVLTRRTAAAAVAGRLDDLNWGDSLVPDSLAFQCARASTGFDSFGDFSVEFPVCGSVGSFGSTIYTEQPIFLDTIGYFLKDSSQLYQDFPDVQLHKFVPSLFSNTTIDTDSTGGDHSLSDSSVDWEGGVSCAEVDHMLMSWGLAPNISIEAFSIPCVHTTAGAAPSIPQRANEMRKKRLYLCIQLNRKMHPLFDRALRGILHADPLAVIAVSHKAEILVDRWVYTLGLDLDDIYSRFVFVPKLRHPDYLKFVSFNVVFLNTFPFGAGVTTSEALSMCVPVLVLPDLVTTVQLALSQIRALDKNTGVAERRRGGIEDLLTAHSVDEYVLRATLLASLVDLNTSQLSAPTATTPGVPLRAETVQFYGEVAALLANASLISSTEEAGAHVSLRRHLCSMKPNLFSETVLGAVTDEWRSVLVRLAGGLG